MVNFPGAASPILAHLVTSTQDAWLVSAGGRCRGRATSARHGPSGSGSRSARIGPWGRAGPGPVTTTGAGGHRTGRRRRRSRWRGRRHCHRPHRTPATAATAPSSSTIPFYGTHQAGIITPVQDRLAFATFDVVDGTDRAGLRNLLADWSEAAARMSRRGRLVGEDDDSDAPPLDTGEAVGTPVSI